MFDEFSKQVFTNKKIKTYNHVRTNEPNDNWQIDLADMTNQSRFNKGFKWLLVVIDSYSRYLWIYPLKTKKDVNTIMTDVIDQGKKSQSNPNVPKSISMDNGTEFTNLKMQKIFKDNNIITYFNEPHRKNTTPTVERAIRTIRNWISKLMVKKNTNSYLELLPEITGYYNDRKNSTTKKKPVDLFNGTETYIDKRKDIKEFDLYDLVRIRKKLKTFEKKSSAQLWGDKVYVIVGKVGYRYQLANYKNQEVLEYMFLPNDLLKINNVVYNQKNKEIRQEQQEEKDKQKQHRFLRKEGLV